MKNQVFEMSNSTKIVIFALLWGFGLWLTFFSESHKDIVVKLASISTFIAPFITLLFPNPTGTNKANQTIGSIQNPTATSVLANEGSTVTIEQNASSQIKGNILIQKSTVYSPQSLLRNPVRSQLIEVSFENHFKHNPDIILTLESLDEGQFIENSYFSNENNEKILHTVNRYDVAAQHISTSGFVINLRTWSQNLIYGYRVSWLAIGEPTEKEK